MQGVRRAEIRSEILKTADTLTSPQPRTGKRGGTGRTGRGSGAAGTGAGASVSPPSFLRRTLNRQTATGRLGGWQRVGGGPVKLPRRVAAIIARKQIANPAAQTAKRIKQLIRVRMEGKLAQRVRVSASMSREQMNDYYAAMEGKISWAQYRARWGHGPQLG